MNTQPGNITPEVVCVGGEKDAFHIGTAAEFLPPGKRLEVTTNPRDLIPGERLGGAKLVIVGQEMSRVVETLLRYEYKTPTPILCVSDLASHRDPLMTFPKNQNGAELLRAYIEGLFKKLLYFKTRYNQVIAVAGDVDEGSRGMSHEIEGIIQYLQSHSLGDTITPPESSIGTGLRPVNRVIIPLGRTEMSLSTAYRVRGILDQFNTREIVLATQQGSSQMFQTSRMLAGAGGIGSARPNVGMPDMRDVRFYDGTNRLKLFD